MEVSGKIQALATVPLEKELPLITG